MRMWLGVVLLLLSLAGAGINVLAIALGHPANVFPLLVCIVLGCLVARGLWEDHAKR